MKRTLGVCYYPEHWPEDIWAEDARRMVDAGLSWVRIGEFAWSRIEPAPDRFDFDWLDRAIDTLGAAGLGGQLHQIVAVCGRLVQNLASIFRVNGHFIALLLDLLGQRGSLNLLDLES